MSYHLRRPGSARFWVVERLGSNGTSGKREWMPIASQFIAKIPKKFRYEPGYPHKALEPFYSNSACGDVWQWTGNEGLPSFEMAHQLYELVAKHNPDEQFHVAMIEISLKRTAVDLPNVFTLSVEFKDTP